MFLTENKNSVNKLIGQTLNDIKKYVEVMSPGICKNKTIFFFTKPHHLFVIFNVRLFVTLVNVSLVVICCLYQINT